MTDEVHTPAVAVRLQRPVRPLATLLMCLAIAGCGDGFNPTKVRAAVMQDHPGADVTPVPDSRYKFLVRQPSGEVLWVEYMASDTKITSSAVMFRPR